VISRPIGSSIAPNTAIAMMMMMSGFQANEPTFSPPSVSMVSDSNRTIAPKIARMIYSPSGK